MSVTTDLNHYVREDVLKDWLSTTFETGTWSCKAIGKGEDGSWQVTAPRRITDDEQRDLEEKSRPARMRTFGS